MSSPRAIIQILITGTRILGKAFFEAGRQAAKNARAPTPGSLGNDVAGVGHASSSSITDQLTRQHRMTLDEAHLILNVKRGEEMENVLKHYEHLFKANSPPQPPANTDTPKTARSPGQFYSHYLQSKVFRARERIEAESNIVVEGEAEATQKAGQKAESSSSHPPPPPPTGSS
ncbi:hypothetical protein J3R30DRAFT_1682557 [Lentinula aciculospora]|uniref:Mitochondrial import inner membrane translocase subunit TIM16 n=1 Tax=Lentinula aciculospora TaxID=153920 RepID=A0A9W8ZVU6_9AGAR|nr:hypothetical protein J3R30DRAFT_1682557 [Lentinula aciculospora]